MGSSEDAFDFDAPKRRDFSKKKYQKQKHQIEQLLRDHGSPGQAMEPSKGKKHKILKILPPAPRRTIFSSPMKKNVRMEEVATYLPSDTYNMSIDDRWFENKEQEQRELLDDTEELFTEKKKKIPSGIFLSDEEKEILPHLRFVATPPIKRVSPTIPSISFDPLDIKELSNFSDENQENF
ncbi:hypothetical protein NEFER03_1870 [Nematocida sp. LUAm3]|nr:hypothetical protein NEFER03_1870 [Nematocida sp. LUAm3]KAI5173979.1 hypothetical protein NEFER02_0446 [Nematocida sp. LUAm2]KAI5177276.1 hypothetical protein NEFER01_0551 [Nematocida sp. LUAm1]